MAEVVDIFHTMMVDGTEFTVPKRYVNLVSKGLGFQGMVVAATDTITQQQVAIKKLFKPFKSITRAKRAYRELKVMKLVNHKNIIGLLNVFTPQNTLVDFQDVYLVMELMKTDLSQIVQLDLGLELLSYLLYQMLCGIKHLHSAGIIHRDLKPSNIAVNDDFTLKILDFGLARKMVDTQFMTWYVVTRHYRAPEVILCMDYTEKIDIWAVGCIMGEMILHRVLFNGTSYTNQWKKIIDKLGTPPQEFMTQLNSSVVEGHFRDIPHEPGISFDQLFPDEAFLPNASTIPNINENQARNLLSRMLVIDPTQRISVDNALLHPYVSSWYDTEVNAPGSQTWNHLVGELEYTVDQWKELTFQEVKAYDSTATSRAVAAATIPNNS